jgi:hypothetical protein
VTGGGRRDDSQSVELSFVDLLYAVPVADLAIRASQTHLQGVPASGWADLSLALWAIILGWIGHHTNRQKLPAKIREDRRRSDRTFTQLRFPQFLLEVLIVVVYYVIGTQVYLANAEAGLPHPDIEVRAFCLWLMFAMYVAWDVLDIAIALRTKDATTQLPDPESVAWARRAAVGLCVSAVFLVIFLAIWAAWGLQNPHPSTTGALWFDLVAIALLFAYRATQELAIAHS